MLDSKIFTYASEDLPLIKQWCIRVIEKLTGQIKIYKLYREYHIENERQAEDFYDASIRKLDVNVQYDRKKLKNIPKTGPLVVVCNHPYGVLDGLILTQMMQRIRPDFRVLTNSVLCKAPEANKNLLPIDFALTKEAQKINIETRAKSRQLLKDGGCIAVFPAGGVSSIPSLKDKVAQDTEWQPFVARLIIESKATVVPVFFEGQNSRLFQLASLFSPTLRLALFFKELADKIGSYVGVEIGEPIPYADLEHLKDKADLCHELRKRTYELGGMDTLPPPKPAYRTDGHKPKK